jgi:hypothetical protein
MQSLLTEEFEIAACLERHAASVRETSPHSWEFSFAGRKGAARIEPDWLLLDIPFDRSRSKSALSRERLERFLAVAAQLDGPAKFGFDPGAKQMHLQADLPLVLEDDPMERIDRAFLSMEQALQRIDEPNNAVSGNSDAAQPANDAELAERCVRWKQLCEETLWPIHPRGASKLAVSLDVPGSFCQAIAEAAGAGSVRIRHEAGNNELSDVSRKALAVFLLTASRVVRMARAYAVHEVPGAGSMVLGGTAEAVAGLSSPGTQHPAPSTRSIGWEILLGDPPAAFEIDRALSALSMACRMTTNELAVLAEDEVARRYLAVQGMVP